jgi:hypothetical protein
VALNGDPAPCCANLRDAIIEPTVRLAIARSVEDSRNHPGLVCVAHGSRLLVRRIIAGLPTKSTQARWSSRGSDWRWFWLSGWLRSRSLLGQLRVLHQVQKLLGQRSEDRVPGAPPFTRCSARCGSIRRQYHRGKSLVAGSTLNHVRDWSISGNP